MYYLSIEELVYRRNAFLLCCCFPNVCYPKVGIFFFFYLFHQGKINASLIFLPLVSCFTESPLEVSTVLQEARRLYVCPHHGLPSPLCTNTPAPSPSRCSTLPLASHPALDEKPALCPGKPVYTTEMSAGAGRPNQLGQEAPIPSVILQQRPLPLALFETSFNSPCQCLSKRHYRQLWTIYSKNTGLTGGSFF